jgi:hypothetical protein
MRSADNEKPNNGWFSSLVHPQGKIVPAGRDSFRAGRSASRGRRRVSAEFAFSNPAHRNHDDDADEQTDVVPLWKVDSDACTSRDGSHAKQNERLGQESGIGRVLFFDSGRWTFWHDGLAWLGGR